MKAKGPTPQSPNAPGRARRFVVNSPELWELLVAPVRSEVGEALRIFGPCSVADIAAALDRPADTLYRHVEALRDAGFVRDAGFRKNGRHTEQLFDVVADDFVVEFKDSAAKPGPGKGTSPEGRAIIQTAESFAKTILKAVKASAEAGELEFEDRTRNISINYELSWLTHDQFQEVRALIRRLKELMDAGKRRREGRLYMTLAIATPVTRKRRSNPRAKANANANSNPSSNPTATPSANFRAAARSAQPGGDKAPRVKPRRPGRARS